MVEVVEVEQVQLEQSGVPSAAGPGGIGSPIATTIFGPTSPSYGTAGPAPGRYFSGGGGGGRNDPGTGGTGGSGGGGAGGSANQNGVSGTTNTGGGGGGTARTTSNIWRRRFRNSSNKIQIPIINMHLQLTKTKI
jgi:hypothetical protein